MEKRFVPMRVLYGSGFYCGVADTADERQADESQLHVALED